MPLYEYECENSHIQDEFSTVDNKDAMTVVCHSCGYTMGQIITASQPMLYFEEGRGRVMHNLGDKPVTVHSHKELEKKMKEKGLEFAGHRRGTPGAWI